VTHPASRTLDLGQATLITDVPMRSRDGTILFSDVFLPRTDAKVPALLLRTPYGKEDALTQGYLHPLWYVSRGYAVVCQDVRGSGLSEGAFLPYAHEAADGADAVAWAAEQPWCDGRVGSYGFSYSGATQLLMAPQASPALRAIAPAMTGSSYCEGWTYAGGALNLAFILSWVGDFGRKQALRAGDLAAADAFADLTAVPSRFYDRLPLGEAFPAPLRRYLPYLADWLAHPAYDDYWRQWSPRETYAEIAQPGLHIAGWYDIFVDGTIENFAALAAQGRAPQRLLVGPWHHMPWGTLVGALDFGVPGDVADEAQLRFFDRWLRGQPAPDAPAVRYFLMGRNLWQDAATWPPPGVSEATIYLAGGRTRPGRLVASPPAAEPPDAMPVNPSYPVPSSGGRGCCAEDRTPMGPKDQRALAQRNDVLLFDSDPLERDLLCVGQPVVELHVSSTGASGDLVVQLVDLPPEGPAINVSDGVLRCAHDGGVKIVRIALSNTAIAFRRGHRIRLQIAGSGFPLYARNPQSGADANHADLAQFSRAVQFVFHDARHPSRLVLPVLKGE